MIHAAFFPAAFASVPPSLTSWAFAGLVAALYWVAGLLAKAPAEPARASLEVWVRAAEEAPAAPGEAVAAQCPAASPQTASSR